jgi:hypothetical protein
VNVLLIVASLTVIVLATKMPLKMRKVKAVTIATVRILKGCVLTTSVARTVTDIRTIATVLATKMTWKLGAAQSVKQSHALHWKDIRQKKEILQK